MVTFPAMAFCLIPVILIEALMYVKIFETKLKDTIVPSTVSNVLSCLIGIPLTQIVNLLVGLILVGISFLLAWSTHQANPPSLFIMLSYIATMGFWLPPEYESYARVPLAAAVGLITAFFVSYWLEWLVAKRFFKNFEPNTIKNAVLKANLLSYSLLFFCLFGPVGVQHHYGQQILLFLTHLSSRKILDSKFWQ